MAEALYVLESKKQRLSFYEKHLVMEWLKNKLVIEKKDIRYVAIKEFYVVDGSRTLMIYPKTQRMIGYGYEKKDRFMIQEINRFLLTKIAPDQDAVYVVYSTKWLQKLYVYKDHLRIMDIRYTKEREPIFATLTVDYEKISEVLMENSRRKKGWVFRGKNGQKGFEYPFSDFHPQAYLDEVFAYVNAQVGK